MRAAGRSITFPIRATVAGPTKGSDMAKYISLLNYSTDALAGFGDLGQRLSEGCAAASGMGVTIESYYLTMGQYDAVVIADAPDNDTVAKFILAMAGTGRFSIQTLAAFDEATAVGLAGSL